MHPTVKRLFRAADQPYADAFVRLAKQRGVPDREVESALSWYARTFDGKAKLEDVGPTWDYASKGWSPELQQVGYDWFAGVHNNGGDPTAVAPASRPECDAARARLAEIRELARTDPRAYDADTAIQSEQLALIEDLSSNP
ncbi:hypothetical protein [Bradyrhizobium sp. BR 10289]|uniref:hypothetical protein n=1 Tax=Bradyrhizobium sp. BR 10289 TaxID=2749993 RepID=UPI001C650426|nr:hypothetical protein [Bradyrhizobium sp. BR 10289]MBW7968611.1 hypothetical protein [Bradyrhizobium sp. BR 10289]